MIVIISPATPLPKLYPKRMFSLSICIEVTTVVLLVNPLEPAYGALNHLPGYSEDFEKARTKGKKFNPCFFRVEEIP